MTRAAAMLVFLLTVPPLPVQAEQTRDFGDYVVHYNALVTDLLAPEVARNYGIQRSSHRGLVNITVRKKPSAVAAGEPVPARVKVTTTHGGKQLHELEVREIREQGAIYYIAEFDIDRNLTLNFDLSVTPADQNNTYIFSFSRQFYVEQAAPVPPARYTPTAPHK
jgi:hypothetical protein